MVFYKNNLKKSEKLVSYNLNDFTFNMCVPFGELKHNYQSFSKSSS